MFNTAVRPLRLGCGLNRRPPPTAHPRLLHPTPSTPPRPPSTPPHPTPLLRRSVSSSDRNVPDSRRSISGDRGSCDRDRGSDRSEVGFGGGGGGGGGGGSYRGEGAPDGPPSRRASLTGEGQLVGSGAKPL